MTFQHTHTVVRTGSSQGRTPPHNTAAHCCTLQHTATHWCTVQHTATHCNTLQHTCAVQRSWTLLHTPARGLCIYIYVCIYIYMYMYIYIHICIYIYIYIQSINIHTLNSKGPMFVSFIFFNSYTYTHCNADWVMSNTCNADWTKSIHNSKELMYVSLK